MTFVTIEIQYMSIYIEYYIEYIVIGMRVSPHECMYIYVCCTIAMETKLYSLE